MPDSNSDGHAVGGAISGPEFADELEVFLVVEVELAVMVVLKLGMVDELLRNLLASEAPHALDFEIGLFAEHKLTGEGVFSEVVKSLQETSVQVLEDVLDLALVSVLVVVKEPEGVADGIVLLFELLHASVGNVLVVHHESLEVEEVPGGGGQGVKGVDVFLGLGGRLGLSGNLLLLGLFLLGEHGLEGLRSGGAVTEHSNELLQGAHAGVPGGGLGSSLAETGIEHSLQSDGEEGSEGNVGHGDLVSNEPVSLQRLINNTECVLKSLDSVIVGGLLNLTLTERGHNGGVASSEGAADDPGAVLVDLGALNSVGTEQGTSMGEELGDCDGFLKVAFGGFQEREFVRGVNFLVLLGGACLFADELESNIFVVQFGNNEAEVDQEVSSVLRVNFLSRNQHEKLVKQV